MLSPRLLCFILCTIYPVYMLGVHDQVLDQQCVDNCSCCEDGACNYYHNECNYGCIDGHRGARCYELCQSHNCKSCGFRSSDPTCTACYDGYYLGLNKDCTLKCPSNCKSCTSSTMCTECKEGFYDENGSTTCKYVYCPAKCECTIGQSDCISCKNRFYDTSTLCNKQCPTNCKENVCDKTSGDCVGGCLSENITGNSCNTCKVGMYGEICNIGCSKNCRNRRCDKLSGKCSEGCIGSFDGTMCDICIHGKYGENCELECPVNCAGKVCEKTSGSCYNCIGPFQGKMCEECKSGYYGPNCNETCSQHCANNTCDRTTGKCVFGCLMGYSGDRCCVKSNHCLDCNNNTECRKCSYGFYTNMCNERCPENCLGSCDISTGECSNCEYSRFGQFCEFLCSGSCKFKKGNHERACVRSDGTCINGCNDGYFGSICNETCRSFCAGGACRQDDGICINGCHGHQEEPECFSSEEQQADEDVTGKTFIVLFSVSVVINIVQGVFIFVKNRREVDLRETNSLQPNIEYENTQMTTAPPLSSNNETNVVSANETSTYEDVNRADLGS